MATDPIEPSLEKEKGDFAKLQEQIMKLQEQIAKFEKLGEGSKEAIAAKAKELEKSAKATDLPGMSDAMGQEIREELRALRQEVSDLKGSKGATGGSDAPAKKGWFD